MARIRHWLEVASSTGTQLVLPHGGFVSVGDANLEEAVLVGSEETAGGR